MAATPQDPPSGRGVALLLEHCAAIERLDDPPPRPFARLEEAVGGRLARLLVGALVGDQGSSRGPLG
jgi:hypothetical protein